MKSNAEFSPKEAKEKAEKLLDKAKAVFLATNGSLGGHPNVRAMAVAEHDGIARIWFLTGLDSDKILELVKDDKATIYGYSPRTMAEFRIWGNVVIADDPESRKHAWKDEYKEYFPGGAGDPNLRVLRFDVSNGMYSAAYNKSGQFTI